MLIGNPIYSCTAMMVPQIPVPPDPIQQMAATQQALINQQALLMVRTPSSLSLFSGNKINWSLSHPPTVFCSGPSGSTDDHAGNESVPATSTGATEKGGEKEDRGGGEVPKTSV